MPVKLTPVARVVAACARSAWAVAAIGMALGVLALTYSVRHFAIDTDSSKLISPNLPWRQNEAAFYAAFPQLDNLIVAVVDGATPELAERGAAALADRLSSQPGPFESVRRPDGGPFFDRHGLLFLATEEVEATTQQLIAAQPFLGTLAADPSLRGVMQSLSIALQGVEQGQAKLDDLAQPLRAFADTFERLAAGTPVFFSWRELITGKPAASRELRRFVTVKPKLNFGALSPGAEATAAIRQAIQELDLSPEHGVRVRLTGSVPLNDEEFATLTENAGFITSLMMAGVLLMLWFAVRSVRMILCILATLFVGGSATAALGLFAIGQFNLISVAFVPLFVGLGVDFAIQFCVRYRAARHLHNDLQGALVAAGAAIGKSLALAAAATAAGFFAFLPTDYVGVSELGLIAGAGMIIAFLLSITLLPALIMLCHPPGEMREVGYRFLASADRYLMRNRPLILRVAALLGAVCLALLPFLRFDFNPINLKSPKVESVSTLLDLMRDPDTTPNTINVLSPSLDAAVDLAGRLSALPEVARAMTLKSFIPADQETKLALISDAAMLFDLTLDPLDVKPPPTDAETAKSMAEAASHLRRAAGEDSSQAAADARRLAAVLDKFAAGDNTMRARAAEALVPGLVTLLDQLRNLLQAGPVTLESLPPDLVQDWIAKDGRARTQVFPRGDSGDNETLQRFTTAVRAIAPDATGTPISIQEASRTIKSAFVQAGIWSFLSITVLLFLVLRCMRDVVLTLIPILLTGLLTLGTCVLIGQAINFANIIVLPLLFGIGVAFNIYFVMAWRSGTRMFLRSSLTRAVFFSALTTASAFGSLWLSSHPGTASMGKLLMISLVWTLIIVLLFQPALLLGELPAAVPGPRRRP